MAVRPNSQSVEKGCNISDVGPLPSSISGVLENVVHSLDHQRFDFGVLGADVPIILSAIVDPTHGVLVSA
jgi:hypothetical protein